uniref:Uncharacterized protein n=1 Tax=Panagrolaimus sp. PS1159 TaxID=55785 RepID=A0AC35FNB4_9BILA
MSTADATTGLCVMLEELGDNSSPKIEDLNNFYDSVFEFGRLNESAVLEFSDAERNSIIKSYPSAVEKAAKLTPDLIQGKSSPNELRLLLQKVKLVTDDLFELYKAAVEENVPGNVNENIEKLKTSQSEIEKMVA